MLKQIDHVNIVVTDLPRMIQFYTQVLGFALTKQAVIQGDWIDQIVGLENVIADVVYLDLASGPRLELIAYQSPVGSSPDNPGQPNTLGLRHLAFTVDDIDAVIAHLKQHDVQLLSQAQQVPDAQVTYANQLRKRLVYFHDPQGNLLELCSYT